MVSMLISLFIYLIILPLYFVLGFIYLLVISVFWLFSPYDYDQDGKAYKLDKNGSRVYKNG